MVQLQLVEHLLLAAVAGQAALVVVLVLRPLFPEDQEVLTVVEVEAQTSSHTLITIVEAGRAVLEPCVSCGPVIHVASHQLAQAHLNFWRNHEPLY